MSVLVLIALLCFVVGLVKAVGWLATGLILLVLACLVEHYS
jgi:hypothetical protein